ncbi:hypothetical protein C8R47DRAFT_657740 [Mycena vitilis]|nr:hypothetical protein C8R47DRAFT_657740 [Mycena vitilis]
MHHRDSFPVPIMSIVNFSTVVWLNFISFTTTALFTYCRFPPAEGRIPFFLSNDTSPTIHCPSNHLTLSFPAPHDTTSLFTPSRVSKCLPPATTTFPIFVLVLDPLLRISMSCSICLQFILAPLHPRAHPNLLFRSSLPFVILRLSPYATTYPLSGHQYGFPSSRDDAGA